MFPIQEGTASFTVYTGMKRQQLVAALGASAHVKAEAHIFTDQLFWLCILQELMPSDMGCCCLRLVFIWVKMNA